MNFQIENPYLEDMRFYDAEFLPLFSFEHIPFQSKIIEEVLKGESYASFTMNAKAFTYNIFVSLFVMVNLLVWWSLLLMQITFWII